MEAHWTKLAYVNRGRHFVPPLSTNTKREKNKRRSRQYLPPRGAEANGFLAALLNIYCDAVTFPLNDGYSWTSSLRW